MVPGMGRLIGECLMMISKEAAIIRIPLRMRNHIEEGSNSGIAQRLENAGGSLICDACTCLSPLLTREEYDGVITNSVKAAHYLNKSSGVSVCLTDLRSIIRKYTR